jgi:hypothetical protein
MDRRHDAVRHHVRRPVQPRVEGSSETTPHTRFLIGSTIFQVCHYPPGTSKWNKIEHRLFCHITQTWRGKPLTSRETIVELIASTTTKIGLMVRCELDTRIYPKGLKVEDADMATLNIKGDAFHPEWNYTIPRENLCEAVIFGRLLTEEVAAWEASRQEPRQSGLAVHHRRRTDQAEAALPGILNDSGH